MVASQAASPAVTLKLNEPNEAEPRHIIAQATQSLPIQSQQWVRHAYPAWGYGRSSSWSTTSRRTVIHLSDRTWSRFPEGRLWEFRGVLLAWHGYDLHWWFQRNANDQRSLTDCLHVSQEEAEGDNQVHVEEPPSARKNTGIFLHLN